MKHNCADYFKVDFAEDPDAMSIYRNRVIIQGNCSKCGRELSKKYVFDSVIDRETGEIMKLNNLKEV